MLHIVGSSTIPATDSDTGGNMESSQLVAIDRVIVCESVKPFFKAEHVDAQMFPVLDILYTLL